MTNEKTHAKLFEILLSQAKERGFGIYGICELVCRLQNNKFFTESEASKITLALIVNRPKNIPEYQAYYWPTNKEYFQHRIDFIERLLIAYKNSQ